MTAHSTPNSATSARIEVTTDALMTRDHTRSARYVTVRVTAPPADLGKPQRSLHVALVLDRSGSMSGEKIRLAREATAKALRMLRPSDRFTLVCFDDTVDVVQPSTLATREAVQSALQTLAGIDARGSTNLSDAWTEGCRQLGDGLSSAAVTRCILLTDGRANQGIRDPDKLIELARGLRLAGIHTSAFGLGRDFDEMLLNGIATAGGGRFCYIEQAVQISDFLQSELGEALEVSVRGVTLHLRTGDELGIELLSHFDVKDVAGGRDIALGDLLADQELEIGLRVKLPRRGEGEVMRLDVHASDRDQIFAGVHAGVQWTSASNSANNQQVRDSTVRRACAVLEADKARYQALVANRDRDYLKAQGLLQHVLKRLQPAAALDPQLQPIVDGLLLDLERLAIPMEEDHRKAIHYGTSLSSKSRDSDGFVRRSGQRGPGTSL